METLKLAIVTDIHHGPTRYTKQGAAALPLLQTVGQRIAAGKADLIVDLGDRISNVDHDTDAGLMRDVMSVFGGLDKPRAHLLGNHDLHYLTRAENEAILGRPLGSHSQDLKGRHLVFWQIDLSGRFPDSPIPSDADLDWLRRDLANTTLPAVIFTHVPLDSEAMTGNYYFQNNTASATLRHTQAAREIIEASGKVILCVAGHVHRNHNTTIDGIRYLTVQSLAESYTTEGAASGAWAEIEIDEQVRWTVHGADPMRYEVPVRGLNAHWTQPLPSFDILRLKNSIADAGHPVRGVILDMDGVLFRGDEPIEGSAAAVRDLQDRGIRVVCLTNNARRTPVEYARKLGGFGIAVDPADIITSGMAVARYLMAQGVAPRVHIVGSATLRDTVLSAGAVESDDPEYVVAGIESGLKIADLTPAVRHLANGAVLLASNADAVIPTPHGPEPEAGPVVAFLEAASGRTATVLGKPHAAIFHLAVERLGIAKDETVMIGDTPETDIAGGFAAGLRTFLVESGNAVSGADVRHEPTARFADLRSAAEFLLDGAAVPDHRKA
ncbi:MAG: HAD-IIA family hydrolase [Alphaproteobacteria bacterium]